MVMPKNKQKFKVSGQLVQKIDWKQMDRRMNRWMDGGDYITFLDNVVSKHHHWQPVAEVTVTKDSPLDELQEENQRATG